MKTPLKYLISSLVVAALVLGAAPYYENQLKGEASVRPKPYSRAVIRAVAKSMRWANERQIIQMVNRAEVKYGIHIQQASRRYYTSPQDIKAIAIVESLVDAEAKSSEGAIGLMGIKRGTGRDMGFENIDHPVSNLHAGTKYYRNLLRRFRDRELALAAYNLGPAEVEERLTRGFDPETMDYIWKIRRVVQIIAQAESQLRPD